MPGPFYNKCGTAFLTVFSVSVSMLIGSSVLRPGSLSPMAFSMPCIMLDMGLKYGHSLMKYDSCAGWNPQASWMAALPHPVGFDVHGPAARLTLPMEPKSIIIIAAASFFTIIYSTHAYEKVT